MKQASFQKINWDHRFSYGGSLRQKRAGRTARPLSSKEPIHLVFKANREVTGTGFRQSRRYQLILRLMRKYSKKFYIKIAEFSVNGDHLHLAVRISRRSLMQNFLRVFAGQIAQQMENEGLLKAIPSEISKPSARRHAAGKSGRAERVTGTPAIEDADIDASSGAAVGAGGGGGGGEVPVGGAADFTAASVAQDPVRGGTVSVGEASSSGNTEASDKVCRRRMRLWKYRPFTRVVRGFNAYRVVRAYVRLNEKEARGEIRYQKARLRELNPEEWSVLWA